MYPYFSSVFSSKPLLCIVVFSTNHYYVLYPSIFLISILNKPLLCIVPIHITHKYSQQTIIMYCTHPYFSSVFSTNHYYVLYPSILLISILNKPLLCIVPIYIFLISILNKSLLCIVPIHISHQYSQQTIIMYCTHPYYSSVFSTNHYYVLYPSILLISILNKPLLCIVPTHISHQYSQQIIIMYCTHPYYS